VRTTCKRPTVAAARVLMVAISDAFLNGYPGLGIVGMWPGCHLIGGNEFTMVKYFSIPSWEQLLPPPPSESLTPLTHFPPCRVLASLGQSFFLLHEGFAHLHNLLFFICRWISELMHGFSCCRQLVLRAHPLCLKRGVSHSWPTRSLPVAACPH